MRSEIVVQHPLASEPLRIPVTVECNTPEDKILANVLQNSRSIKKWVKIEEPHDRVAVLVGGGPSLADTLDELTAIGGDVFALNGAASFLNERGILPDYQVIMDARPQTADLIGPAKHHLFASQVDPVLFARVPDATLWHTTYGDLKIDEQDGFPVHDGDYCIVGAAVTVGNTALPLLYVLGYRTIHVFGMDSSHKDGKAHAYHQPMNDGEPCTVVSFAGREYTCSVAMELQARNFAWRANQLKAAGVSITVHGDGLLPALSRSEISEAEKYQAMWERSEYREVSPGELVVGKFMEMIPPKSFIIDFGCGTGRAALKLERAGHFVTCVDFTDNSRDPEARGITFVRADLTRPLYLHAKYGFCTDVMEHISTEFVDQVFRNIMACVEKCFFQISTVPDNMGALIGLPLHLTVQPHEWWAKTFEDHGLMIEWQERGEIASSFFVTKETE